MAESTAGMRTARTVDLRLRHMRPESVLKVMEVEAEKAEAGLQGLKGSLLCQYVTPCEVTVLPERHNDKQPKRKAGP